MLEKHIMKAHQHDENDDLTKNVLDEVPKNKSEISVDAMDGTDDSLLEIMSVEELQEMETEENEVSAWEMICFSNFFFVFFDFTDHL